MTQKGYGPTAVQTGLQRVPRVHLTKPIIALFVVMKAQFSEVYYNETHSENSGNGSTGSGCDGPAVAWITLTFHPLWLLSGHKIRAWVSACSLRLLKVQTFYSESHLIGFPNMAALQRSPFSTSQNHSDKTAMFACVKMKAKRQSGFCKCQ